MRALVQAALYCVWAMRLRSQNVSANRRRHCCRGLQSWKLDDTCTEFYVLSMEGKAMAFCARLEHWHLIDAPKAGEAAKRSCQMVRSHRRRCCTKACQRPVFVLQEHSTCGYAGPGTREAYRARKAMAADAQNCSPTPTQAVLCTRKDGRKKLVAAGRGRPTF